MTDIPLKLFNSLTRKLETFRPVRNGEARVYTCGPTVYNYPHIGNMRAYVFADVLGRTLSFKGYKLTHVINITDVGHLTDDADAGEDKLEKAAAENAQNGLATSIWKIARYYTEAYWDDVKELNIRGPMQDSEPSLANWTIATDFVPAMIEFAEGIAAKHCYELDSGLYFDVSTVADYGRLARAQTEAAHTWVTEGRIELIEEKRNAADFAIWRKTPPGETRQMEWDSPWGRGAPGWHLECSVMSGQLLGFPFDIHTGGIDHREIHHPNEIAQNQAHCCTNGLDVAANSGANIWMHNNFLVERSGKMSKSSGEFLRLQLLIDRGYHPLAYRMMCLQAHYRSELEFSWEGLGAALVRLKRLVMGVERLKVRHRESESSDWSSLYPVGKWTLRRFKEAMVEGSVVSNNLLMVDRGIADDLSVQSALLETELILGPGAERQSAADRLNTIAAIDDLTGLRLCQLSRTDLRIRPKAAAITEPEIEAILTQRKEARAAKDFATSDALRNELAAQGVEVMDGDPLRWDWKLGE